jgi:hypothetical protein
MHTATLLFKFAVICKNLRSIYLKKTAFFLWIYKIIAVKKFKNEVKKEKIRQNNICIKSSQSIHIIISRSVMQLLYIIYSLDLGNISQIEYTLYA